MADCDCQGKIDLLTENLAKLNIESKNLKGQYNQLLIENLQKDVIIRNLKQKLEAQYKYGEFNGVFSAACLDKLRATGNSQVEDSSFISNALKDLYHGDVGILKEKTLTSRSNDSNKKAISPQKLDTLSRLYEQRLSYIPNDEVNDNRRKNLNKLIRNAIDNAKKSAEKKP